MKGFSPKSFEDCADCGAIEGTSTKMPLPGKVEKFDKDQFKAKLQQQLEGMI